jgi:TRAP-type C4-dicarboxylate transport system permease small subunit
MLRALNACVTALETLYKYLAVFFTACSVVLGVGRVVVRHLPFTVFGFVGEFSIACFVWAVLMAIAWQVNTGGHLSISVFYDKLPPRARQAFSLAFLALIVFTGFLMLYEGIIYINNTKGNVTTYFGHPRWITFYLPLPVCGFGVIVFGIRRFIVALTSDP